MAIDVMTSDAEIAAALLAARGGGPLVNAESCLISDFKQAYRIQALVISALEKNSGVQYWKSGGDNRAAILTHAQLPSSGVWSSPGQANEWPFWKRGVEAEIALRINKDVDVNTLSNLDDETIVGLIDGMAVTIELVDSRWHQGFSVPATHKLADQQLHGALVLGPWHRYSRRDWKQQKGKVCIGEEVISYVGSHSLNDPAWLISKWLSHSVLEKGVVPKGSVVTTGTWCGLQHANPGDEVVAFFDGIGESRVKL